MPRLPRLSLPFIPQHVIQRGNNRQPCFLTDGDYRFYLTCLNDAVRKYGVCVHAYVLMTNHVHLLMTPESEPGISRVLQAVGRRYVRHFNDLYGRSGTLWEGRYRSSLVQDQAYLLSCYRYIELNPVRAGMIDNPARYPWSSYPFNALGHPNPLLKPHAEYLNLGTTPADRQAMYRAIVGKQMETELIKAIRTSVQSNRIFGSEMFQRQVEATLTFRIVKQKPGPRKQTRAQR